MKISAKPLFLKFLLALFSLAVVFSVAEIAVRNLGEWDASGNFYFKNRIIRPHQLPLAMVADRARALKESDDSIVTYHEVLGWAPRPDSRSADGLYEYNSQGLRSPVPSYAEQPPAGTLRIAMFGDSFTHGDDVPFDQSFGAVLEKMLNDAGIPAEVMNFGVGGYGIDQALLRFSRQGATFHPDVVIFGFAPENLKRNLNLVRPLYDPRSGLPFAKPRIVLSGQEISLINVPVPPPDELVGILRHFDKWDLVDQEYFYDPADFRRSWWQASKLLATAADLRPGEMDPWLMKRIIFQPQSEEGQLGMAVIRTFGQEVARAEARFLIAHLPSHPEMELHKGLGHFTYQKFLDALDQQFEVIHPEGALFQAAGSEGLTEVFRGHYNEKGCRIVAESIYDFLTR